MMKSFFLFPSSVKVIKANIAKTFVSINILFKYWKYITYFKTLDI